MVSLRARRQHFNKTDKSTHIQADPTRPSEQLDRPQMNTGPNTSNVEYPKASTVRPKKRIRKPTRNADGVLIRKDGMPDRRGKILRAHKTTRLPNERHLGEERTRERSAFWRVVDFAPDLVRTDKRWCTVSRIVCYLCPSWLCMTIREINEPWGDVIKNLNSCHEASDRMNFV